MEGARNSYHEFAEAVTCSAMAYSLFLHDRLLGETDFEHAGSRPGQRIGAFRATEHGMDIVSQLTGFFAATLALHRALEERRLSPDGDPDDLLKVMEGTPEGARVIEIAKITAELVLRDASGARVRFKSIAISNPSELAALVSEPGDPPLPPGGEVPRFLISATMERGAIPKTRGAGAPPRWRRRLN